MGIGCKPLHLGVWGDSPALCVRQKGAYQLRAFDVLHAF
jgi:hypothetical protein